MIDEADYSYQVSNKVADELKPQVNNFLLKFHNAIASDNQLYNSHQFLKDQLLQYAAKSDEELGDDHLLLYEVKQIISNDIPIYYFDKELIDGIKTILNEPNDNPLKRPAVKNPELYTRIRKLINDHYAKYNDPQLLLSKDAHQQEIEAEGIKLGKLKINFNDDFPAVELVLYREVILASKKMRSDITYEGKINPKTLERYLTNPQSYPNPLEVIDFDYPFPVIREITHQLLNVKPVVKVNAVANTSSRPSIVVSDQAPTPASFEHEPKLIEMLSDESKITMIFNNKLGELFTPEEARIANATVRGNEIRFTYSSPGQYRGAGISNRINKNAPNELTWYFNGPSTTRTPEEQQARDTAISACDKFEKTLGPLVNHTPFNRKGDLFYRTSRIAIHSNFGGPRYNQIKVKFEWLPNGTVKLYGKGYFSAGGGEVEYRDYTFSATLLHFFSFYERSTGTLLPTIYNLPPLRERSIARPAAGAPVQDLTSENTASAGSSNRSPHNRY